MRTIFTIISCLFLGLNFGSAQVSFSDNFDTYTNGAYLASSSNKWTTWSNKPGTTEDAKLSSEQAKSGTLSAKIFSNSASGGPMDVVLPFGGRYTTGKFTYSMSLFIPKDKNAYFNFQATTTIGQTWALDVDMFPNGNTIFSNGANQVLSVKHKIDTWFDLDIEIDLSTNVWVVSIDGQCVGSFKNAVNSIASLNLYPKDNKSLYYVDDVSFDYNPTSTALGFDASITNLVWPVGQLSGIENQPVLSLLNNGSEIITSADISVIIEGEETVFELKDLSLSKGNKTEISLPSIVLKSGANEIDAQILKINGVDTDENICNNSGAFIIFAITAAPNRAVLVEEGTGTWCVWCPRGAVFMDNLSAKYKGLFIPIAVHNNDPMVISEYNAFMAFTGFPNSKVNRGAELDPSASENPFLTEIVKPAAAQFLVGSKYDETTKRLDVSVEVDFLEAVTGNHFVSLVLTEDGVRGTTATYNQANAYANGTNGPMGGYEFLPNPVPASQMVYDHVARAVSGLTSNANNSFSGDYNPGDKVVKTFSFVLDNTWKSENMHIVPILLKGSVYINAATTTMTDALANGFISSADNIILSQNDVKLYPNPSNTTTNIDLTLAQPSQVEVQILTLAGSTISQKDYGTLSGDVTLPINLFLMNAGIYLVKIKTDAGTRIQKLIVE